MARALPGRMVREQENPFGIPLRKTAADGNPFEPAQPGINAECNGFFSGPLKKCVVTGELSQPDMVVLVSHELKEKDTQAKTPLTGERNGSGHDVSVAQEPT